MKTENPQTQSLSTTQASSRSAMIGGHHPSSTRLSDKAFYLIALALLLKKSAEPGSLQLWLPQPAGSQSPSGPVPIRG